MKGWKKDSDRAMTPAAEAVRVLTWVPASQAAAPPSCSTLIGAELPQAKNVLHLCVQGRFSRVDSLRPCRLWPARLLCQGGGFSRQEYWSILVNTGHHTLLEHCISCCPGRQPPEYLVLPEPCNQAAAPPPRLALTGVDPSPPGQPQEQTPVDDHMQRWK